MGLVVTYTEIADQLIAYVTALDLEARQVYSAVVLPAWDSQSHRYPITLYGLILAVKTGLESYVHDLSADLKLQKNCMKVHPQVELQRFQTRR